MLSHLVPADDPSVTEQSWIDAVRGDYDGPVVVARDGMRIDVAGEPANNSQ
ncbi:beta-lactamase-like protein [Salinisphaera shabanensis T35B1]